MAIIKMKKVFLMGLQRDQSRILEKIQRLGNVEISEIQAQENLAGWMELSSSNEKLEILGEQLSEVQFALEFLGRYKTEKKGLFSIKPQVDPRELQEAAEAREEILKIAEKCRSLDQELNEFRTAETRIHNLYGQFEPWKELRIPLEDLHDTARTRVLIGGVAKNAANAFEGILNEEFEELLVQRVGEGKEEILFFLTYHRDLDEAVGTKLKEFGFSRTVFGEIEGTPSQKLKELRKELDDISAGRLRIQEEAKELLNGIQELELLYDGLSIELERLQASHRLLSSNSTFLLNGWIPAEQTELLVREISQVTEAYQLDFSDPEEDEDFPVALENPPLVKPFEAVTSLYSTPHSRSIDPNIFMAPFFFIFFGMMVGDAPYGLIMAVAAGWLTVKLRLKGGGAKLGWLLCLGGISTLFWGILFGSWFGDVGTMLGIGPVLFSPMDEPILMLALCFGLGAVQVFAGLGVQAYINIRRGDIWSAVFDQGLWYVLLIGLGLLAVPSLAVIGKYMALGGTAGLILTQGRHKKNIVSKLFSGILSLYNITGFFSDILSYSRLFALGLTTGIIAMVINKIGGMIASSWIGVIFAIPVLVGGHAFNIAINALGAYVHSSRLQYIEFFGRFFEGGGRAFQPLRVKTKFTELKTEEGIKWN